MSGSDDDDQHRVDSHLPLAAVVRKRYARGYLALSVPLFLGMAVVGLLTGNDRQAALWLVNAALAALFGLGFVAWTRLRP